MVISFVASNSNSNLPAFVNLPSAITSLEMTLSLKASLIVTPLMVKVDVFVQESPEIAILLTSFVTLKTNLPAVLDLPIFKMLKSVQAASPLPPLAPS